MSCILVSGGAGYIGSHTCVELLKEGHELVVVDNLSNSYEEAVKRIQQIAGRTFPFYAADVCDKQTMMSIFSKHQIDAVIHFAGLKAVGESVSMPLRYYRNNLDSTMTLCEVMQAFDVNNFIFSSSATVYGMPGRVPITEDFPLSCTNPYGWSKFMNEQILRDLAISDPEWSVVLLRYFNPIGAHSSGLIGEDPAGIPNNLMPYIAQVAIGRQPHLNVFGQDYPTPDGTGVRDYIHVVDLAAGHCRALDYSEKNTGVQAINLGTGHGISVLEMVKAFEGETGKEVPYKIAPRRPGDVARCYADTQKAADLLGWKAENDLAAMCRDTWRWQQQNPYGYRSERSD